MTVSTTIQSLREEDIAEYLINNPDFFERQAVLLGQVRLHSPHGGRAVSLQERQAEMLREKIKVLERRIMDMVRHGNENTLLNNKLLRWAQQMFQVGRPADLPEVMARGIRDLFGVPQVTLKVWDVAAPFAEEPFAQGVSDDVRSLANSLAAPYCGLNSGFDAVRWLADPDQAASVALIALRRPNAAQASGLLVLASPDAHRYEADMATDFQEQLAELASAAISRLQD